MQELRFTQPGLVFIGPEDDPAAIASLLSDISYTEEFCIAQDFSPAFIARLMAAGFLVMSMPLSNGLLDEDPGQSGAALLLPKLHLERSVLFFDKLHESRTVKRLIPRYELNAEMPVEGFQRVLGRCVEVHGDDWLTPPLRTVFKALYAEKPKRRQAPFLEGCPRVVGFGLYRRGRLVAGEFGAVVGRVYTSYSGYYDEDSAGSVQLALTGRYLRDAGFAFWDLGMPLPYKEKLGAQTVDRAGFLELFRMAAANKYLIQNTRMC